MGHKQDLCFCSSLSSLSSACLTGAGTFWSAWLRELPVLMEEKKKRKDSSNKISGESFAVEVDSPASAPKWNENWNGYKFQRSESQTAVLKSDVTSCHALRPSVPRLPEVPGTHLCVQWHLVTKKMKGKSLGHFERGSPPTSSRYSSRTNVIDFGSSLRPTYSCSKAQTLPPCHVNV